MIVRARPGSIGLLFVLQGSIVPAIAGRLLFIIGLSLGIWLLTHAGWLSAPDLPLLPFSFLGLALSVFLGFRNSACYERWWEARKQWGDLIVQARSFARETHALLGDSPLQKDMVRSVIVFTHALAQSLRGSASATESVSPWLNQALAESAGSGKPDHHLLGINQSLATALRHAQLSDVLYQTLSQRLLAMASIQAACERIRNTPTPFAYSLLLHRTAWMFCLLLPWALVGSAGALTPLIVGITAYTFFGLDALGDELEEPFGLGDNDLPLNAMVRTIEIDLLEIVGESPLPAPLQVVDFRLR